MENEYHKHEENGEKLQHLFTIHNNPLAGVLNSFHFCDCFAVVPPTFLFGWGGYGMRIIAWSRWEYVKYYTIFRRDVLEEGANVLE